MHASQGLLGIPDSVREADEGDDTPLGPRGPLLCWLNFFDGWILGKFQDPQGSAGVAVLGLEGEAVFQLVRRKYFGILIMGRPQRHVQPSEHVCTLTGLKCSLVLLD